MSYRKIILILFLGIFLSVERNANAQSISFSYTGAVQQWTVPCATSITVSADGAGGGQGIYGTAGKGAEIAGTFTVLPGEVIYVLVGQGGLGGPVPPNYFYCGSGGGGSYVWNSSNSTMPMVVAGGGGGSAYNTTAGNGSATTTPNPSVGGGGSAPGGTGGNGGSGSYSGGGAGWLSNGTAGSEAAGGADPANGAGGGVSYLFNEGGTGGYGGGGGGAGNDGAGGGGGGYNGGGGGTVSNNWGAGGGGGSYNGGTNQTNTAGVNSGNGSVTITWTVANLGVTDSAYVIANVDCHGNSDASATALATGVGLSYSWTGGQTTDTATGLSAGTYTVIAHSVCGDSASSTVTITQPNILSAASAVATENVLCNGGNNGVATASTIGGGSPFAYSWAPSGQTTKAAIGLSTGTYTVTVVDVCAESATASVTITQPNAISVSANETANVSCMGINNGSASSTVVGGAVPYTYSWSPSGGNLDTAVGLSAGTYTLNVRDNNGCTGSASIAITQPAAELTSTAFTTGNALCNGSSDGSAAASISGGTSPYTYSWTGGSTNATASGLSAGTYTMTVTDNHGCTSTASAIIKQPAPLHVVKDSTVDSGACTGTAWVIASGGVAPYTYAWSDGSTSYYIHYTCPSKLCCTVEDANGCTKEVCIHVISVLGVDNLNSDAGQITVYPNPNNGEFTIESTLASGGSSTVEVYNVLGEKVYTTTLNSNKGQNTTVNISNQPGGIYLYRVISNINGSLLGEGKIVLQK